MVTGPGQVALALVYDVFKTYLNGIRPHLELLMNPAPAGVNAPAEKLGKVEKVQALLFWGNRGDPPGGLPLVHVVVVENPALLVYKFPRAVLGR